MKICYLILCHVNESQVTALIEQLSNESADFYIHVDKKAGSFEIPRLPNVYVVSDEKRIDVSWGGNGMVIAALTLIDYALRTRQYDYVFLISGQCFPIKTNKEIIDYLECNKGHNYIDVKAHDSKQYVRMLKRTELYYPSFLLRRTIFAKVLKHIYILLTGGRQHTFRLFCRKNPCGLQYEFGSSWWILTYDCVAWMKKYIDDHTELIQFFDHSLNPDESFFQMLFMASPYQDTRQDILTYLEWERAGKHPRVLVENDVPMLLSRSELFARKFDIRVDKKPLELLSNSLGDHS